VAGPVSFHHPSCSEPDRCTRGPSAGTVPVGAGPHSVSILVETKAKPTR
jgi:hypothetical protein